MGSTEIINQIKETTRKTITIHWKLSDIIQSEIIPTKWNICIHYNPENLNSFFKIDILKQWSIANLEEGILVVQTILIENGYSLEEINVACERMIVDLDLKNRDNLFICWYTVKN